MSQDHQVQPSLRFPAPGTLAAVLLLPALHALCLFTFPARAIAISDLFALLVVAVAAVFCGLRALRSSALRLHWILLVAALCLWFVAMTCSAWEDLLLHADFQIASTADLAFFLYTVPIMLAISMPLREERIPLFFWMDSFQASTAAVLCYVVVFLVIPFTGGTPRPISSAQLVAAYQVTNFALAFAASLRLLSAGAGEERNFYRKLNLFLWPHLLCSSAYNHVAMRTNGNVLYASVLIDLPFLLLAAAAAHAEPADTATPTDKQSWLAQFIHHASPFFFTLMLIGIALAVSRTHYRLGAAAVLAAALIYGARVAVLHVQYSRSQRGLREAHDRLERLSVTDALTGLFNRRGFDRALERAWNQDADFGILLIDVDHFKGLNDQFGHEQGDDCLRRISASLQESLGREEGMAARFGGEEFTLLVPNLDFARAGRLADRTRAHVASLQIPNSASAAGHVTISIGIAIRDGQTRSAQDLLISADRALYRAKQNGRNRTEFSLDNVLIVPEHTLARAV